MKGADRKGCPYCSRKHLAAARRTLWELEHHADDPEDPHLEIFIGELEHAEVQLRQLYPQVAERVRRLKLIFDQNDIWTGEELSKYLEVSQIDMDRELVIAMMDLRECVKAEKIKIEKPEK